jgi:RNA polymerase sigma-70 factor, ECF subfamily
MEYSTAWQNKILISSAETDGTEAFDCAKTSDKQLIELVLAGDESAFENIFNRYKRLVAAISSRYFQRPEQIEEIIQITFTKVYFECKNFHGQHNFSLASWLGKITTNLCLDALRHQKRKAENLLCELSDAERENLFTSTTTTNSSAENSLINRDLAEKLLSHLSAEDRAVLQMLDAEQMSVSDIAQITGWSNSKIKVRAYRARTALRKILQNFL